MTDIAERLTEITAMIAEAREAVSDGDSIDLAEIQARVQNICLEIQDSPPENAVDIEHKIVAMIDDLNALARDLANSQHCSSGHVIDGAGDKDSKTPGGDG